MSLLLSDYCYVVRISSDLRSLTQHILEVFNVVILYLDEAVSNAHGTHMDILMFD